MTDTPQVLLHHHLKKLRLPTFQSEYAKLAQQCAAESKDHVQYLLRLCELELIERALPGQLGVLALEGRQPELLEMVLQQHLRCIAHAAVPDIRLM